MDMNSAPKTAKQIVEAMETLDREYILQRISWGERYRMQAKALNMAREAGLCDEVARILTAKANGQKV